jgi:hypothetical protein
VYVQSGRLFVSAVMAETHSSKQGSTVQSLNASAYSAATASVVLICELEHVEDDDVWAADACIATITAITNAR